MAQCRPERSCTRGEEWLGRQHVKFGLCVRRASPAAWTLEFITLGEGDLVEPAGETHACGNGSGACLAGHVERFWIVHRASPLLEFPERHTGPTRTSQFPSNASLSGARHMWATGS
jgi:hypothetical protein